MIQPATQNFIAAINNFELALQDLSAFANDFVTMMNENHASWSEEMVQTQIQALGLAINLDNRENAFIAAMVLGSMVEAGYNPAFVSDIIINLMDTALQTAKPLFERLLLDIEKRSEEEKEQMHLEDFINSKFSEIRDEYPEEMKGFNALEAYYLCAVAVFSSSANIRAQAKERLVSIGRYADLGNGCYWLSKLFKVLHQEPILVIDLVQKRGFVGTMYGVADNFQLQQLLMIRPEITDELTFSEAEVANIVGYGPQSLNSICTGKWDLYDWHSAHPHHCNHGHSAHWIWGEGTPSDIPTFEQYRVVLLGPPSYTRTFPFNRMFKCLKAGIDVEKVLTAEDVDWWMNKFRNA